LLPRSYRFGDLRHRHRVGARPAPRRYRPARAAAVTQAAHRTAACGVRWCGAYRRSGSLAQGPPRSLSLAARCPIRAPDTTLSATVEGIRYVPFLAPPADRHGSRIGRSVVVESVPRGSRARQACAVTRGHNSALKAASAARERPNRAQAIIAEPPLLDRWAGRRRTGSRGGEVQSSKASGSVRRPNVSASVLDANGPTSVQPRSPGSSLG
jgi:hypothetical protein